MEVYGYTKDELSSAMSVRYYLNISTRKLYRLLNGDMNWRIEYAIALSEVLDIPMSQLFELKRFDI